MNIREFLDQYPLPWRVKRDCIGIWIEDNNGIIVTLDMVVKVINSEFQPLNTRDLPGQSTLEYMCWQDGTLLTIGSGTPHGCSQIPLSPLATGGGHVQYKPDLVEQVTEVFKDKMDLINDLRGIITRNEARTKILGWEPLKGERGDQLLE